MRSGTRSQSAFEQARRVMPGGVSSPVRAFKAVGGTPRFIDHADGCRVFDVDGNAYVDYVMSYGPHIAGHNHPTLVEALRDQLGRGTSFGMPSELETTLASTITHALPAVEMVRFVNSGTEAAMSAIRLARAATKRDLVVKCAGCYHGHVDGLLVEAGSGLTTLGAPTSPGVPVGAARATVVVPYNDLDAARRVMEQHRGQIACFAVEPVAGNMGLVPPDPGYLQGLRQLCDQHGTLLLFDEVMTGFRVAWGGAQNLYRVRPDITCLGKIIGGGLPVGAYGARRELMSLISPEGSVYQAGTLSGNPLAMTAGIANLSLLDAGAYARLERSSGRLVDGLARAADRAGVPVYLPRVGSMVGLFFTRDSGQIIADYDQARTCRTDRFTAFFNAMLDGGVMLAPSMFEALFVSLAHDDAAIDATIEAGAHAFAAAAKVA
jgi:glutamate-1-semialdehyde 2,1-aminomutase